MRPPSRPDRTPTDPAPNRLAPSGQPAAVSRFKGDLPPSLLDRYLIEHDRRGRAERFFRDHRAAEPAFRDAGRALVAATAYPDVVADMLKIARHRGWAEVRVQGDAAFKREVWVQAQALDITVKGHRPSERDRQAAGQPARTPDRETARARDGQEPRRAADLEDRLRRAAVVVRGLIADPEVRARLLARAWSRAEAHLERAAARRPRPEPPGPVRIDAGRRRDRDR